MSKCTSRSRAATAGRGAKKTLKAVDGVSFDLYAGETLGVVGESGCGKSTLSRAILNLIPATAGEIVWMGKDLRKGSDKDWLAVRKDIQMIFQDPLASLNPRMTVAQIIGEPLRVHKPELGPEEVMRRVKAMMAKVGLREQMINRYPHEFSGGQCQRIGIARALILEPKLIICDEPVSALDVSIQAQIINLLKELQREMGLALIFIAHDLAVVKHISDRILVMYLGREMELAEKYALYDAPSHPYTRALLSAIPIRTRSWKEQGDPDPARRPAQPDQSAVRLRVPYPLPAGGSALRARDHAAAPCQRAEPDLLPAGLSKREPDARPPFMGGFSYPGPAFAIVAERPNHTFEHEEHAQNRHRPAGRAGPGVLGAAVGRFRRVVEYRQPAMPAQSASQRPAGALRRSGPGRRRSRRQRGVEGPQRLAAIPVDSHRPRQRIESPELLNERAPDYWGAAWRARRFLEQRYGQAIPRELLSLTVNSQYGRTQNQLHIHISCTDATVRQQLEDLKDSLGPEWRELPVELQGHAYWARTLAANAGGGPEVDPFKALAAGLPEAGLEMGRYGLALVATRLADGRDGFILLSSRASLIGANRGSVEELQDHACPQLRAPAAAN